MGIDIEKVLFEDEKTARDFDNKLKSLKDFRTYDVINTDWEEVKLELSKFIGVYSNVVYDNNPNNMGIYLPKMNVYDLIVNSPNTSIIKLPDWVMGVMFTLEQLSEDKRKYLFVKVTEFLKSKLEDDFGSLDSSSKYFIKTGTYSGKFTFFENCLIGGREINYNNESLGRKAIGLLYESESVGAGVVQTIIVREYIESSEDAYFIYDGMPLRDEIRVFVNFDSGTILGYSDYWCLDYMKTHLEREFCFTTKLPSSVFSRLNTEELLGVSEKLGIRDISNYLNWYLKQKQLDTEELFEKVKVQLGSLLTTSELTGSWSLDFMFADGIPYFIDGALMEESALVDIMETVNE